MARSRSFASRVSALAALGLAVRWFSRSGPAYAVKGGWEGSPSALKDVVKGDLDSMVKSLEPHFDFPSVSYDREGLGLSVEDGHLNVDYASTVGGNTLNLRVNEEKAWRADVNSEFTSLRVRGQGLSTDGLSWEASQANYADGIGDVKVEFNSANEYNLTLTRQDNILDTEVDYAVRATKEGFSERVAAHRQLGVADVYYTVSNPVGKYDARHWAHDAQVKVQAAGGEAALKLTRDDGNQGVFGSYTRDVQGGQADIRVSREGEGDANATLGYKASYARSLNDLTSAVDADVLVGVDQAGAFGKVAARRDLGNDLGAAYEVSGRVDKADGASYEEALKLSHKLGYAEIVHSKGESPRLRVGYEFNA